MRVRLLSDPRFRVDWAEQYAVIVAKTTMPQSIMCLETTSFLGTTVNPYNRLLSAGGSSGGAGALLALRGCLLAVGSDIGGSVRSPSAKSALLSPPAGQR